MVGIVIGTIEMIAVATTEIAKRTAVAMIAMSDDAALHDKEVVDLADPRRRWSEPSLEFCAEIYLPVSTGWYVFEWLVADSNPEYRPISLKFP